MKLRAEVLEDRNNPSNCFWTGNYTSGYREWTDPANWLYGSVPASTDTIYVAGNASDIHLSGTYAGLFTDPAYDINVLVKDGETLTLRGGYVSPNSNVVLESDATFNIDGDVELYGTRVTNSAGLAAGTSVNVRNAVVTWGNESNGGGAAEGLVSDGVPVNVDEGAALVLDARSYAPPGYVRFNPDNPAQFTNRGHTSLTGNNTHVSYATAVVNLGEFSLAAMDGSCAVNSAFDNVLGAELHVWYRTTASIGLAGTDNCNLTNDGLVLVLAENDVTGALAKTTLNLVGNRGPNGRGNLYSTGTVSFDCDDYHPNDALVTAHTFSFAGGFVKLACATGQMTTAFDATGSVTFSDATVTDRFSSFDGRTNLLEVNKEVTLAGTTVFEVYADGPVPVGTYPILTSAVGVTGTAAEGSVPVGTEIGQNATTVFLRAKPPVVAGVLWNDGWVDAANGVAVDMDTYLGFIYAGLGGVTVTLYDSSDAPVGTAVTDAAGNFSIEAPAAGTGFYLVFGLPTLTQFGGGASGDEGGGHGGTLTYTWGDGQTTTPVGVAFATAGDSRVDGSGATAAFDLAAGDVLTFNAGAYAYA